VKAKKRICTRSSGRVGVIIANENRKGRKLPLSCHQSSFPQQVWNSPGKAILYILVENNEEIRIATTSKYPRKLSMYDAEQEDQGARLLNDPLQTPQSKIKAGERVHFEGLPTPPPSTQRPSSTPIVGSAPQFSLYSFRPPYRSPSRMSLPEQPRSAESSLAPKPFGGATTDTDNAERWLLYLKKYIDYRHLRGDEALALFKLLLIDQAQDWLYALPEGQADSFEHLEEAFMQRFTPNPLQRYQKASHMWTRNQGPTESVDAYITALKTAANQIQFRDEQQLGYCIIRGLRAPLRMHVLQNQHGSLEEIAHSARVAEIATAGATNSDKTVAELSRTVSVLVDKLTAKDNVVATPPVATVAAVAMGGADNDRQPRRHLFQSAYNRPGGAQGRQQRQQPPQQSYQDRGRQNTSRSCGNCLGFHDPNRCPAFSQICYNCNRRNHFARACRSRPQTRRQFSIQ
jgi:hypothetical protein